ncbi:uncharacterized protein EKO05_0011078 [Ascochyta rabiei]|uniref:uncharacterized protein n=1 Tax=Didymella rabiei TaxID=5454 RepID=UPI0021FDD1C3|nr:uncharacterized protein EKO05_0011078 [Ascochyta rabiei]UPX20863.1 hypothetical protein EKO05_0011078 [Ascochyta rabiei]
MLTSRQRDLGLHFPDIGTSLGVPRKRYATNGAKAGDPHDFYPSVYPGLGLAKAWAATAAGTFSL